MRLRGKNAEKVHVRACICVQKACAQSSVSSRSKAEERYVSLCSFIDAY